MALRKARPAGSDSLLPGYSGLTEIGGGAFATVYRAVEVDTGRPVALKILKVDTIHAHLIETFHQEIQALAQVSDHPNIVTLYRPATTTDGRPVLVLELCRGSLASQVRAEGPLGAQEATRVGVKIAGALETAHRNGFLHRDMKPQNILVTRSGEPALADFGVAALQASAQATAGVFGFTTLHAAPEMLEGHHLSPATDIYGLASTMYQLLTGQAPFASFDNEAPASVILRILRDPVRPLRAEHIPLTLSDLLEAALSKEPEGRPRTALEFALALQDVESSVGWPVTDFLAWGEEGAPAGPPRKPARGPAAAPAPAGPDSPDGGRTLYQSAPSVRVEAVENPGGRPTLPPLLPTAPEPRQAPAPAADAPPAGRVPAAPSPSPAMRAARPAVPPGDPAVPSAPAPVPPEPTHPPAPPAPAPAPPAPAAPAAMRAAPPVPPPPPSARRAPSVARPEPGVRQVVNPAQSGRGQPSPPLRPPAEPLTPLQPRSPEVPIPGQWSPPAGPAGGPAGRPVFVDPAPHESPRAAAGSVYEETMAVTRLTAPAPEADHPPGAGRDRRVPLYALLGLVVAAAVVLAAVLLVVGVL